MKKLRRNYKDILSKKLSQLSEGESEGDLSRLIRQGMYLEHTINECINRLYKNPFIGEKYNGEMIEVLSKHIDIYFWKEKEECKKHMNDFLNHFNAKVSTDDYEELDEF